MSDGDFISHIVSNPVSNNVAANLALVCIRVSEADFQRF